MIRFYQQLFSQQGSILHNEINQSFMYASISYYKGKIARKPLKNVIQGSQLHPNDFIESDNCTTDNDVNSSLPLFKAEDARYNSTTKKSQSKNKFNRLKPERTPNLLTWAEKEKIRNLHQEQPNEWTPERLAGNFPATRSIINRILKKRWKPRDVEQHDQAVHEHWQQLIAGEIEVSPYLKQHLLTFAPKQNITKDSKKNNELSEKEKKDDQLSVSINHSFPQKEIVDTAIRKDHLIWSNTGSITKYQKKRVKTKEQKPLYPERINIPKEKWQEGATYKVGDVYYDSDGTFLYRVPGIS